MAQFEYQVIQQAGGRVSHFNERLLQMVQDGWHPVLMSGDAPQVSLLLRRDTSAAAQKPAAAQQQAAQQPARPAQAAPAAQPGQRPAAPQQRPAAPPQAPRQEQ